MFILAKLVFKSYMPKQLEKGMWFLSKHKDVVYGKIYEYITISELQQVPQDMDSYIAEYGAPVEPYIIQPMINKDEPEEILVHPDHIGWWEADLGYEDEDGDWVPNIMLEDLTPKIVNEWIHGENGEGDGLIALEVDDDRNPKFYEDTNKVVIKQMEYVDENDADDADDEDYNDYIDNWDDMDDWPDDEELVHEEDEWPDWGPEEDEKADYEQRKKEEDI